MPALNFQKRFAPMVESGAKPHTIRAPRADGRPHATVGARLYLYTGMRTKACRKLGESICTRSAQVVITETRDILIDGSRLPLREAEAFARRDGFDSLDDLVDWFEETHGLPFEDGALIEWQPLNRIKSSGKN